MSNPNIEFLSSNQNQLLVTGILEAVNIALMNIDGKEFTQELDIKRITIKNPTGSRDNTVKQDDLDVKVNGNIKSYGMREFRNLREEMGINEDYHIESLSPENN